MLQYSPAVITRAIAQATGIAVNREGDLLRAYPDPGTGGDPWTIGYGSTRIDGRLVQPGDEITQVQAEAFLNQDLMGSCDLVMAYCPVMLNGDQLGALTSFMNNEGPGRVGLKDGMVWLKDGGHSTLFKLLCAGDFDGVASEFGKWVYGGGRVLPGLVVRRKMEHDVFLGLLDMTTKPAVA